MKFTIVGLNIEYYVGDVCYGHNCNFAYEPEELELYRFYFRDESKHYWELILYMEYGECGSGWTTACWCFAEFDRVDHIGPFGYKPKDTYLFELDPDEQGEYHIEQLETDGWGILGTTRMIAGVFAFSFDGGDGYYPNGWINIDLDKFEKLPRAMEKRPVWIFTGDSATGKSTLGFSMKDKKVYETDSSDTLPETIDADVVILGNKNGGFAVKDVKEKLLGDPNVIIVTFKWEELS